jgi:predicted amidophosphoribosyltransferase
VTTTDKDFHLPSPPSEHPVEDHLGHHWQGGTCTKCTNDIRDVSTVARCGDLIYFPRRTEWCPHCLRPVARDGCPCRTINGVAP